MFALAPRVEVVGVVLVGLKLFFSCHPASTTMRQGGGDKVCVL